MIVHLETPGGRVYLALDDAPHLRPDGPTLTRAEIDAVLSLACRIAPADHTKLTLWRELRALLALKRALPEGSTATLLERGAMRGVTVDLTPASGHAPATPEQPAEQQLPLLA